MSHLSCQHGSVPAEGRKRNPKQMADARFIEGPSRHGRSMRSLRWHGKRARDLRLLSAYS